MITAEIDFHAPRTQGEVLARLAQHGDEAKLLGGGMSLLPAMNLGVARPTVLISLNHVPELSGISERDGRLRIGGTTRHAQVATDPLVARHAQILAEAAGSIGDVQVRNRGTIGGSVAHADPAADYLPVLVALGAEIEARSATRVRAIPAREFFIDVMQTALAPDELITAVLVPRPAPPARAAYRRLVRVEGSFAIVNAAAVVRANGTAFVVIGGVGPRPVPVDLTEALDGGVGTRGAVSVDALARVADAVRSAIPDPFEDLSGDAEFRREMAAVHARRAIEAAARSVDAAATPPA